MGRPRAVSTADMNRTLTCLAKAGIPADRVEIIIEPGRVRILPIGLAIEEADDDTVKPKEWPSG